MEEIDEGDQRLCVDAWKGQIVAPSDYVEKKNAHDLPDENIELTHAFGFRSFDTRNNLFYTADPNVIVYSTAALGVAMEKKSGNQKFFIRHDDDVVSLDIHPNLTIVATGQMAHARQAKLIEIHIWSLEDFSCLKTLKGSHRRAIRCVKFSPDGT